MRETDSPIVLGEKEAIALRRSLLAWYKKSGRDLPWRRTRDPYAIWISEVMLQQTQVKTVIPYYERWLEAFPTVEALAQASQTKVLKQWEGLGYYSRARNLHRAAQQVVAEFGGIFPKRLEETVSLPGIGKTTAGGILSAAFNASTAILDGNVKRVLARLVALDRPPAKAMKQLWTISEELIDPKHGRDFNQAIMDLGATVCTAKQPVCLVCPWRLHCRAYNLGTQLELPMREASRPIPHKIIGVAVIRDEAGKILIDRRKQEGLLGGLWEFPGGKVEPGESLEDCVRREIKEELDLEIAVDDLLISLDHAYTHFKVTLNVFNCRYVSGEAKAIACDEIRWVTLDEIEAYPFPKANGRIIEALKKQG